ncbi:MAG: 16S rRNA (cytosine(967)-C(5))-methyltransferase RsmB [Planctomycetes bacterium]|nr:16S rRNA (cytosine(967)-C(5))-methyltransferase RsmB [Planctomycetota bacterium]
MSKPTTAREIAYAVLSQWNTRSPHGSRQLDELANQAHVPPVERGLARELVHGIMRRRDTLSALIRPHVNRPLAQVETGALALLWLGAYQRVMLSGIPEYAVVNETTELARRFGKPQWTGFINAVLRALGRSVTEEFVATPARNNVPLGPERYRVVTEDVFPDPRRDWIGYYAMAFSFPRWLVERWAKRADRPQLIQRGFWFNSPTDLCLRVNTLRTSRDAMLAALAAANVPARAGHHPDAIWLEESTAVPKLPGFDAGWFAVQDESAISAGALLNPQPGERVLDLCAAPGGKTAHLAALMQNQGQIVATDIEISRLQKVTETCQRLGVSIVETRLLARDDATLPGQTFDRILLDVPCSNTGVLGKRPEARWRLSPQDLPELVAIQSRLLRSASDQLLAGGHLVYSTCSIEPEENRAVVETFLKDRPDFSLLENHAHSPGQPVDGGYQALLRRNPR